MRIAIDVNKLLHMDETASGCGVDKDTVCNAIGTAVLYSAGRLADFAEANEQAVNIDTQVRVAVCAVIDEKRSGEE